MTHAAPLNAALSTEPFRAPGHGNNARIGLALIHGFTGNPASLRPLAEGLAARGFAIDLPRLPGHGTHVRDMARTTYPDYRAEVVATIDRLTPATDHVVLVGLSMGATLALDVAATGDRSTAVAGVVAINPQILDREGLAVKLAPLIERVLPLAPATLAGLHKDDIAKPGVSELAYDWVPTRAGNSLLRELPRIRARLPEITCPVLVAHSRVDHSVPPENSQTVLELVKGGLATELVLERSFHVATLDYDRELLEQRIAEFAERVSAQKTAATAAPDAPGIRSES
ncbi:MAG TPA: alpha/beta fold hydrolase [Polyangiaceae bacterium]|nr:alpha/beta fold hydrolase [Polyangiaceae bacterium]